MHDSYEEIETNIGRVQGMIDKDNRLIIENENPNLLRFMPGLDTQVLGGFLKNPDNSLIVMSPEKFKGEWIYAGRDNSCGTAYVPPPFIFMKMR